MDEPKNAMNRLGHLFVAVLFMFSAGSVWADYAAEWGPKVGTALPAISAPDQDGNTVELTDLQGENGVLIIFNRSADW